ncbi:hypothetical protein [Roseibium sediminis]|uniref:hypothetical protein n=1 Tax=Roseibium sediminis TaxID=1775174 RepID=UPI00123CF330|nr:hypothetical protein [Roseibium sediminis]
MLDATSGPALILLVLLDVQKKPEQRLSRSFPIMAKPYQNIVTLSRIFSYSSEFGTTAIRTAATGLCFPRAH